ncbi:MAG: hypothetical protein ACREHD_22270 [Pirellulales bacterium]
MARETYLDIGAPRANGLKNPKSDDGGDEFGLVANGSEGSWDVDVDESLSGEQRWYLQIDGPAMYLDCEIEHPRVVEAILRFLSAHTGNNGDASLPASCGDSELEVARKGENRVALVWDTRANDRCAVLISGPTEFCARFILERGDLQDLIGALRQVHDELLDAGLAPPTLAQPSK